MSPEHELLERALAVLTNCQISSGDCCCGEKMATHSRTSHTPYDLGTYIAYNLANDIRAHLEYLNA